MKKTISGIELRVLTQEFQALVGAKVDKIFQQDKNEFYFRFHKTGIGKVLIRVMLPDVIYIASTKQDSPDRPSGFCMYLRKYLSNARIKEIHQQSLERILRFTFETKEGDLDLVLEFFSKGNLILIRDGIILSALHQKKWKDREILPKRKYEMPPSRLSAFEFDGDLPSLVEKHGSLVKALAIGLGLGGVYAEEVLKIAGVDKSSDASESVESVKSALVLLKDMSPRPVIVRKGPDVLEVSPYLLHGFEASEIQECDSFSEALDQVLSVNQEKAVVKNPKIEKTKKIIKSQEEQLNKFDSQIEKNKEVAQKIYDNYDLISEVYAAVNRAIAKNISWNSIKEELENHESIVKVDTKTKKVTIEVQ